MGKCKAVKKQIVINTMLDEFEHLGNKCDVIFYALTANVREAASKISTWRIPDEPTPYGKRPKNYPVVDENDAEAVKNAADYEEAIKKLERFEELLDLLVKYNK